VVLSRDEIKRVLAQLEGTVWLMAALTYGGGLRLLECLRLRVKDLDFDRAEVTIRDGKGQIASIRTRTAIGAGNTSSLRRADPSIRAHVPSADITRVPMYCNVQSRTLCAPPGS
jgi:integrase